MTTSTTTQRPSPAELFEAFHAANPRVYALLVMLTWDYIRETGHPTVGFSLIYGAARWKWAIETRDEAGAFKLNNDYAPFYARLIMGDPEARLPHIFNLRLSEADDWAAGHGYPVSLGYRGHAVTSTGAVTV